MYVSCDGKNKNLNIAWFGIFSAIVALLTFTPLGYIPLGAVSATTVHVPVIIVSIIFGPLFGSAMGLVMGMLCLFRAVTMPSAITDVFFMNPIISVLPRICIGVVVSLTFEFLKKLLKQRKLCKHISIAISAILGTLTNTVLVLFFLVLFHGDKISVGISQAIPYIVASVFAINGLLEIIVAVVLSIPICIALFKLKDKIKM